MAESITSDKHFPDLAALYEQRGGRASGESDFGVWWSAPRRFPHYRVSVIHDTGDLYAVDLHGGGVELLATLRHDCKDNRFRHHEPGCAYDEAKLLLVGWVNAIHEPNSLAWVRERVSGVAAAIGGMRL